MSIFKRVGGAAAVALAAGAVGAGPALAQSPSSSDWGCSGTALNVLGLSVFGTGSATTCGSSATGLLNLGPALGVMEASTSFTPGRHLTDGGVAVGQATIARTDLNVAGIALSVRAAQSKSQTSCQANVDGRTIDSDSFSSVDSVVVNGRLVAHGEAPARIALSPIATLWVNRTIPLKYGVTRRVVQLDVLGRTVAVVGESSSELRNPAAGCSPLIIDLPGGGLPGGGLEVPMP